VKHLKLIVDNKKIKQSEFFSKKELKVIFDLYAEMVSCGQWKDYGLNLSRIQVSFNIYRNATEFPIYKITKNFRPKNKNDKYIVKDLHGNTIKSSENLENLIQKIKWKKSNLLY